MDVSTEALPRLHVLVSDRELDRPAHRAALDALVERRAPIAVHLRTRQTAAARVATARRLVSKGAWCVVNGRPDVALAAAARGVQLGSTALGVADTRAFLAACGGDLAVGASTRDEAASASALSEGADFLVLGAIFPTESHPGEPGRGVGLLTRVASRSARPVLAIGGIDAGRIPAILRAGAAGAVVSSAVWSHDEPIAAVERLLSAIEAWNPSQ